MGATVALLLLLTPFLAAQEAPQPGFGPQPGIVQPRGDAESLTKRVLSSTEYKLTPGDSYELVVILDKTERFPLLLTDDYLLDIPYVGSLNVRGMYFSQLKQEIVRRIKARVPVLFVDFVLTSPALFDVFVHGGVKSPGIATVNPLSRVTDALLLAGGLMEGASFRSVELVRAGQSRQLDLSRFTADGDLGQNPLLEPGDRIHVLQAAKIVELQGRVKFPGPYELLPGEDLAKALAMAGGPAPDAEGSDIRILRFQQGRATTLDVAPEEAAGTALQNLDRIVVGSLLENQARVTVDGALYGEPTRADKPVHIPQDRIVVNLPHVQGMTLLALLDQMGGPTPLADLGRSYLQHKDGARIPLRVQTLWETRDPEADVALQPGDLVVIPIKVPKVFVAGEVNSAGSFPFTNGYRVADYLLAAGGVNPENGDPNRLYFVGEGGARQAVSAETPVTEPGTLIYVDKNNWAMTNLTITRVLVITGLIGALLTIAADLMDLAARF
jgi:polysaccharide export outer membrane protein